jgi:hypothetical protein
MHHIWHVLHHASKVCWWTHAQHIPNPLFQILIVVLAATTTIITTTTTFMQSIYNYIHETNHILRVYSGSAVLYLQFVLHVMLFHMWESGSFPHKVFVFHVFRSSYITVTPFSMILIKLIKKPRYNFITNLSSATCFSFVRHLQAEYTIVVWTIYYNAIHGFHDILSHIIIIISIQPLG